MTLYFGILFFSLTAEENANRSTCRSQAIYKVLPENYDKEMPPLVKGKSLNVYVFFWIISVTEINEMTQDFTVDMYFRMYWTDFRISFPACEKASFVILDREQIDQIWVPDIYFIQSKRSNRHKVVRRNAGLKLDRNNEVFFSERLTITKFCAFDFRFFPLDRQACSLAVESYDFSGQEINVSFKAPGIYLDNSKFKIPQYELSMVKPHDCSYGYLHEGIYHVNQSCIQANFVFDRQFSYYFVQMYLPSILIVLVSFLSFWIPVDNVPGRISLGVTSLLTLATQFTTMQRSLPPVSYMKAMDIWMFYCILVVFFAMVEFTLAYNFRIISVDADNKFSTTPSPNEIDEVKDTATPLSAPIQRQKTSAVLANSETSSLSLLRGLKRRLTMHLTENNGNFVDNISKIIFPFGFVVFNIGYWNHYGHGQRDVAVNSG